MHRTSTKGFWVVAALLAGAGPAMAQQAAPGGQAPQFGRVDSYRPATGSITVDGKDMRIPPGAAASLNEQIRSGRVDTTQPFIIEYTDQPADPQQTNGKPGRRTIGTVTVVPES